GIAPSAVLISARLAPVVFLFNGSRSLAQIAEAARSLGSAVDEADLDEPFLLDTPRFRERRSRVIQDFASAPVRPALHAGGAYHADAGDLRRYIEDECLSQAPPHPVEGRMVGLCAPH